MGAIIRTVLGIVALLAVLDAFFKAFLNPWTAAGTAGALKEWGVGFENAPAGLGRAGLFATILAGVPIAALGLASNWLARNWQITTLQELSRLRPAVQRLLLLAGVGLALSTLGMAALTRARKANTLEAPIEYVWIHGIVHSLVLALAYAPTHAQLLRAINSLRNREAPLPEAGDAEMAQKIVKRRELEQMIGLESAGLGSLGSGWPVLLPMASSLLSTILGPSA
jgi:hypothetical protein